LKAKKGRKSGTAENSPFFWLVISGNV